MSTNRDGVMFSSKESFGVTESGGHSEKGCRVSTVSGFVLTFLFLAIAVLVGLIVHFAGTGREVVCSCNCGDSSRNQQMLQQSTIAPTAGNVHQECKKFALAGNPEICGACPKLTTMMTTTPSLSPPTTTTQITTTTQPPKPIDRRLPTAFSPYHYNLRLRTPFEGPPEYFYFNGSVRIYMKCMNQTNNVTLHTYKFNFTEGGLKFQTLAGTGGPSYVNHSIDEVREFLIIHLDKETTVGEDYTLDIDFSGFVRDGVSFYKSSYVRDNKTIHTAFTQFEAIEARRAFPCFDEPAMKATFNITLERRADSGLYTLANTPLMYSKTLNDGYIADVFETTVVMQTYLVAFAYVDFAFISKISASGTKVSIYTQPDYINQTQHALNIAVDVLDALETYFNIEYMMPKLDHIGANTFRYGAMENWGLIVYKERYLWYKENATLTRLLEYTGEIITHEVAHMWFGNLVTLEWWDHAWLNEAFALFFSFYGMDLAYPTLGYMDLFIIRATQDVMAVDSYATSVPVVYDIGQTYYEILFRFDIIIYEKGGSILRMLKFILGDDTFRYGLQIYLNEHAYGNANTNDLWNALAKRIKMDRTSELDIKTIGDTWVRQNNYPVVTVTKQDGQVSVTQSRFLLGDDKMSTQSYMWEIPFTYTTKSYREFEQTWHNITWIHKTQKAITVIDDRIKDTDWIIGNIQAYGYYRVNYDEKNWDALRDQLLTDHTVIPIKNRAQIINDAWYLSRAGLTSLETALDFLLYLKSETGFIPWHAAMTELEEVENMIRGSHAYLPFELFMSNLVKDRFDAMKLHLGDQRSLMERHLDNLIYSRACRHYVSDCSTKSTAMFNAWRNHGTQIHADIMDTVLCTAIREGGIDEWDYLYEKYKNGSTSSVIINALGCSRRNSILNRYLKYAITPGEVRKEDVATAIIAVGNNPVGRNTALKFVIENWKFLVNTYKISTVSQGAIVSALTAGMHTPLEQGQLVLWMYGSTSGTIHPAFSTALEKTKVNKDWQMKNYKTVESWLYKHSGVTM